MDVDLEFDHQQWSYTSKRQHLDSEYDQIVFGDTLPHEEEPLYSNSLPIAEAGCEFQSYED